MQRNIVPPSRAAYKASQNLFEVLSQACDELDLQADSMKQARDQVQQMHAHNAAVQETPEFKGFIQNVVDSWSWSLKTNHTIFSSLVELTKSSPGRDAASANARLSLLFVCVKTAIAETLAISQNWDISDSSSSDDNLDTPDVPTKPGKSSQSADKPATKGENPTSESSESSDDPEDMAPTVKSAKLSQSVPKVSSLKKRKTEKLDAPSHIVFDDSDHESPKKILEATPPSKKQKVKDVPEPSKLQHEVPSSCSKKSKKAKQLPTDMAPPHMPPRKASTEDISAEVDERIKAKAEKKLKKKEDKKRKRDSIASSAFSPEPTSNAAAQADEVKAAQPPKKKAKVAQEQPVTDQSGSDVDFRPAGAKNKGLAGADVAKNAAGETPGRKKKKRRHSGEDQSTAGAERGETRKKKAKTAK
ncbi:hypothetical protein MBLNU459_g1601t1 [Dothideomycetes sp. NU459]